MEKVESKRRNSKNQDVMGLKRERKEDSPVCLCRRALEELMCLDEDAQGTREERWDGEKNKRLPQDRDETGGCDHSFVC